MVLVVKNPPANAGDARHTGLIPGLGRPPVVGNDNHSSILPWKNVMDIRAWWATVYGVTKSREQMSSHTHSNY